MDLHLTTKQFRRLLDMAYIGNWVLNSARGEDRFRDYDKVESLLFAKAAQEGMPALAELWQGEVVPSRAFAEGGIHEAIADYEDAVFFDILAEELARRDMDDAAIDESNRPCAGRERSDLNSRKGLTHTVGEPFSARGGDSPLCPRTAAAGGQLAHLHTEQRKPAEVNSAGFQDYSALGGGRNSVRPALCCGL